MYGVTKKITAKHQTKYGQGYEKQQVTVKRYDVTRGNKNKALVEYFLKSDRRKSMDILPPYF